MKKLLSRNSSSEFPLCWGLPVKNKVTSRFAAPRQLPSGRVYFHSGLDLRAYTGAPITAIAQGIVVFANHMTVPGNMVVIDHGHGLFSRYMHLSHMHVEVQDSVVPGQLIGESGSTGRVEAAHLHWEILWKGQHLNPQHFIQSWNQKFCQKSLVTFHQLLHKKPPLKLNFL